MSIEQLCRWLGMSRQAWYQYRSRQQIKQVKEAAILTQVRKLRQNHTRMGGRKLLHRMRDWLVKQSYKLGRDRLFDLLRQAGLLVRPKRRRTRTTWAGAWRCKNHLASTTLTGPHQAWVSDITYLRTRHGFCYLTLITDAFSRYIVGYAVSNRLTTDGSLRALQQALVQRSALSQPLIHHSDRGVQFTDHRYRQFLADNNAISSMGAKGDCYDNALAERMNGILKLEYGLDGCFRHLADAQQAVRESVWLYNCERPHLSLQYQTPAQVHTLCHAV